MEMKEKWRLIKSILTISALTKLKDLFYRSFFLRNFVVGFLLYNATILALQSKDIARLRQKCEFYYGIIKVKKIFIMEGIMKKNYKTPEIFSYFLDTQDVLIVSITGDSSDKHGDIFDLGGND